MAARKRKSIAKRRVRRNPRSNYGPSTKKGGRSAFSGLSVVASAVLLFMVALPTFVTLVVGLLAQTTLPLLLLS